MSERLWHAAASRFERAAADHRSAAAQRLRVMGQYQQGLIDAEVRETRRVLLHGLWRRGGAQAGAILDEDFLAVADLPTVCAAIVDAAITVGAARCADLQLVDGRSGALRLAAQHGFPTRFLDFFATVHASHPTACAMALATGRPVFVDDVARSPVFARETLEPMLDAGSRAVYSYPLRTSDGTVGVLSFHHSRPMSRDGGAVLVAHSAAEALSRFRKPVAASSDSWA